MHQVNVGVRNLFQGGGAGNAAVGVVVIGQVQGGGLGEAVVHIHRQGVLAGLHLRHGAAEAGESVVVVADLLPVQINVRRVADAGEAEQQMLFLLRHKGAVVPNLAPVQGQLRNGLPDTRHHGGEGSAGAVLYRQRPQAVQRMHRAHLVLIK